MSWKQLLSCGISAAGASAAGAFAAGAFAASIVPCTAHDARPIYIRVSEVAPLVFALHWDMPPTAAATTPLLQLTPDCRGVHEQQCASDPQALLLQFTRHRPSLAVVVETQWRSGQTEQQVFPPGERRLALRSRDTGGGVLWSYLRLGVRHILTGWDHLTFLAVLFLLLTTWRSLVLAATGFTLGHSLTLAGAALGRITLPPAFVETMIALSIILLAVVVREKKDDPIRRAPMLMAGAFGLLHGMGFATFLLQIGLPQTQTAMALLGFNLGVEVGQLIALAACAAFMFVAARFVRVPQLQTIFATAAGGVASYWFLARASALFLG